MSLFKSPIEEKLFNRIMNLCADWEDGETSGSKLIDMACTSLGLDEDVAEWAFKIAFTQGAQEAVIEGKTKLSDHFTPEQIAKETGREEDEGPCEHTDVCEDERVCLDCGEDRTEHMMAKAYDYYKDRMKYGDD